MRLGIQAIWLKIGCLGRSSRSGVASLRQQVSHRAARLATMGTTLLSSVAAIVFGPIFIRLVISCALLGWSAPQLYEIFTSQSGKIGFDFVKVGVDCTEPMDVAAIVVVGADDSAIVHLSIGFSGDNVKFPDDCTTIVTLMGIGDMQFTRAFARAVASPSETYPVPFEGGVKGIPALVDPSSLRVPRLRNPSIQFSLPKIISYLTEKGIYGKAKIEFVVEMMSPDFLSVRTYSARTMHYGIFQMYPGYGSNSGKLKLPWSLRTEIELDPVYDVTGSAKTYDMSATIDGGLTLTRRYDASSSDLLFLQNSEKARTKDLRIVFAGGLLATGAGILCDLLVDLGAWLRSRRKASPITVAKEQNPPSPTSLS